MRGSRTNTVRSEIQEAFDQIWTQRQELQNWSSSSWWFFILLPKQDWGYGPRQMMFTFASRAGKLIKVNRTWQKGFDHQRKITDVDKFMTTVVGWINDGKQVHEEIVHQPALASLSKKDQSLTAWERNPNGNIYGAKIKACSSRHLGINARFKGQRGSADFRAWSNPQDQFSIPQISDIRGPLNGKLFSTHLVAWRKLNFEGSFTHPGGTEELSGMGYFQRVCMNIPMMPWHWLWILFEDESLFSCFLPHIGMHAFRRHDNLFRPFLEKLKIDVNPVGYFNFNQSNHPLYFDKITTQLLSENGTINRDRPLVLVVATSKKGDYIRMKLRAHGRAQFLLDRRIIKKMWQTKYNYNEYMVKVEDIQGRVRQQEISESIQGQGWGNMEYTWGMSL